MKTKTLMAVLITGTMCQFTPGTNQARAADAPPPNTLQVIQQKIRSEVAARLAEKGGSFLDLKVAVAEARDSGTPFKVTYRGLQNFTGNDGTTPAADGEFIMNYIGGGQWQGALAGTKLTATLAAKDDINLPFINDPQVLGEWESVDFVADIATFNPTQLAWQGDLYLKGLTFLENGRTSKPWWTWTKGLLLHRGDQTASHYEIKEIGGAPYLFLEWKSGDVTIAGMKPHYYVLKPKPAKATP